MALKQYFYIVLVPLKFIPKRTASFWQTIKIPNRFVLKICTGGFADYTDRGAENKRKKICFGTRTDGEELLCFTDSAQGRPWLCGTLDYL